MICKRKLIDTIFKRATATATIKGLQVLLSKVNNSINYHTFLLFLGGRWAQVKNNWI